MPDKKVRKSHIWARHPEDWYVEEQWCSVRLFEEVMFEGLIHDPCCGMGRIIQAARDAGYQTSGADIQNRLKGRGLGKVNFTKTSFMTDRKRYDNIVCNPPFKHINEEPYDFMRWALDHAHFKLAVLVPLKWITSDARTRWLEDTTLREVYILTPRPSMPPGTVLDAGEDPGGGREDFCWCVFESPGKRRPALRWMHRDD
jgi:hypothetical protein